MLRNYNHRGEVKTVFSGIFFHVGQSGLTLLEKPGEKLSYVFRSPLPDLLPFFLMCCEHDSLGAPCLLFLTLSSELTRWEPKLTAWPSATAPPLSLQSHFRFCSDHLFGRRKFNLKYCVTIRDAYLIFYRQVNMTWPLLVISLPS